MVDEGRVHVEDCEFERGAGEGGGELEDEFEVVGGFEGEEVGVVAEGEGGEGGGGREGEFDYSGVDGGGGEGARGEVRDGIVGVEGGEESG